MKIALNIKNNGKIFNPSKNDVILYDGKDWYITTKQDIFAELNTLVEDLNNKIAQLEHDNQEFKEQVAQQLIEMGELVRSLITAKGE